MVEPHPPFTHSTGKFWARSIQQGINTYLWGCKLVWKGWCWMIISDEWDGGFGEVVGGSKASYLVQQIWASRPANTDPGGDMCHKYDC